MAVLAPVVLSAHDKLRAAYFLVGRGGGLYLEGRPVGMRHRLDSEPRQ